MRTLFLTLTLTFALGGTLLAQQPRGTTPAPKSAGTQKQPAKTSKSAKPAAKPIAQQMDLVDIRNAFSALGIEAYKFPISGAAGQVFQINYVVEEWESGALKGTYNWLNVLQQQLPEGTNTLPYMDKVAGSKPKFIRVYAQTNHPTHFIFRFGTDELMRPAPFTIDTNRWGAGVSYAVNAAPFVIGKKTALVFHCLQVKGKPLAPFKGGQPMDIVKAYPRVFVVYAQPMNVATQQAPTPSELQEQRIKPQQPASSK
ncbi:MAG: hypothetical protein DYG96_04900 [Chlorobi bacterium CHB2]|nr:hypothetical protein [Chlorobi bacterium CHB2]